MKYLLIVILLLILWVYHPWFNFSKTLSSGDWPYLFKDNIQEFQLFPQSSFLWLEPYYNFTSKIGVQLFPFSWEVAEKIFWFGPFIVISLISSWIFIYSLLLHVKEFSFRRLFTAIGSLIYVSNTYILMIVGGGQMGVGMAYAFSPLILYLAFNLMSKRSSLKIGNVLLLGVIGGIQLMFDPRFFILTFFSVFISIILVNFIIKLNFFKIFYAIIFAIFISLVINLFWIIPNAFSYKDFYNDAVTAITIHTLSFAQFSNSISLLHPNWPENIFGKIGFMKPEFIFIAILAYSPLFLLGKIANPKEKAIIVPFSFLAITGAFFAKGINPPLGEIYIFLSSIPGFLIFRDPTKWYLFIAISYSVLIPYLFSKLFKKVSIISSFAIIMFLIFWVFIIRQSFFGKLNGTFNPQVLPVEYLMFESFINNQPDNFSTLWIPTRQRFGYSSIGHPAISAEELFNISTQSALIREFSLPDTENIIKQFEVKYVVIPYDSRKEIFLNNNTYDENKRLEIEKSLDSIVWLKKIKLTNKLIIYKVAFD